ENLLVLEGVHAGPEAVVPVRDELPAFEEAPERLIQQLLAVLDVVEDALSESKVAAVDTEIRSIDVDDRRDQPISVRRDEVAGDIRLHVREAGGLAAPNELGQLSVERQVGEAVGIVREKDFVVGQVLLDRSEALTDVGRGAGVDKGDPPIVDVAVE